MTDHSLHRRYLLQWALLVVVVVGSIAAVNLIVDPYGVYAFVSKSGLNEVKPHAGANGAMAKAYQLQRVRPRTLILGNSRAEVGFIPLSPAWPPAMQRVYNAALPGTGPITSLRYLRHAMAVQKPTVAVLGVDFMDFLVREDERYGRAETETKAEPGAAERRLLVTSAGAPNPAYRRQRVEDIASSVFSLDAFIHSINTVASQLRPDAPDLTDQGFNPMRDYEGIARREGYEIMFRQRDEENTRAYLRRAKRIYQAGTATSSQLDIVRNIIAVCREHNIELRVVIYPYHAHLLETFHSAALWPEFEEWKRALTRLVDEGSRERTPPVAQLWDFSGYNNISAEQVPEPGDRKSSTRWYWEAGHFKQDLGDVMLQMMFAGNDRDTKTALGVQLTLVSVEQEIERVRRERTWYEATQGTQVRKIRQLVERVKGGR